MRGVAARCGGAAALPLGPEALAAARRPLLAPQRLYVLPAAHPLAAAVLPGRGAVTLVCRLGSARSTARLAWLWDHRVRGRALLPAAATPARSARTIAPVHASVTNIAADRPPSPGPPRPGQERRR